MKRTRLIDVIRCIFVVVILGTLSFASMAQSTKEREAELIRKWNEGPQGQKLGKVSSFSELEKAYAKAIDEVCKEVDEYNNKNYHTNKQLEFWDWSFQISYKYFDETEIIQPLLMVYRAIELYDNTKVSLDSVPIYFQLAYQKLEKNADFSSKEIVKYGKKSTKSENDLLSLEIAKREFCLSAGLLPLIRAYEGDLLSGGDVKICETDIDFDYWLCRFLTHPEYGLKTGNPDCVNQMIRLFKSPNSIPGLSYGIEADENDKQVYKTSVSNLMFQTALKNLQKKDYERAWILINDGASWGNSKCNILRAYCTMNGLGTQEDKAKAMKIIEEAASKDNNWDAANILEMVKQASK